MYVYRQTDRQTVRGRQAGRQTDRQTDVSCMTVASQSSVVVEVNILIAVICLVPVYFPPTPLDWCRSLWRCEQKIVDRGTWR